MQFEIKQQTNYSIQYGHQITRTKFAFLPTRVGKVRIWLESFCVILKWTEGAGRCVYNGTFHQRYEDDWVEIKRFLPEKKCSDPNILSKDRKDAMAKSFPSGDRWTFRKVIRVRSGSAWYKKGDVLKVKHFATFGCFDHKDRWIDYWDVGPEIPEPKNWGKKSFFKRVFNIP